jgi:hypothetical protein
MGFRRIIGWTRMFKQNILKNELRLLGVDSSAKCNKG